MTKLTMISKKNAPDEGPRGVGTIFLLSPWLIADFFFVSGRDVEWYACEKRDGERDRELLNFTCPAFDEYALKLNFHNLSSRFSDGVDVFLRNRSSQREVVDTDRINSKQDGRIFSFGYL